MARRVIPPQYDGSPKDMAQDQVSAGLLGIPVSTYHHTVHNKLQDAHGQMILNQAHRVRAAANAVIATHGAPGTVQVRRSTAPKARRT